MMTYMECLKRPDHTVALFIVRALIMATPLAAALVSAVFAAPESGGCKERFCRNLCLAWGHETGVCLAFWPYRDQKRCHCSDVWFRPQKRGGATNRRKPLLPLRRV
ncbi:uncharacterized protein LOC144100148 [Amblyomma americanum]